MKHTLYDAAGRRKPLSERALNGHALCMVLRGPLWALLSYGLGRLLIA